MGVREFGRAVHNTGDGLFMVSTFLLTAFLVLVVTVPPYLVDFFPSWEHYQSMYLALFLTYVIGIGLAYLLMYGRSYYRWLRDRKVTWAERYPNQPDWWIRQDERLNRDQDWDLERKPADVTQCWLVAVFWLVTLGWLILVGIWWVVSRAGLGVLRFFRSMILGTIKQAINKVVDTEGPEPTYLEEDPEDPYRKPSRVVAAPKPDRPELPLQVPDLGSGPDPDPDGKAEAAWLSRKNRQR